MTIEHALKEYRNRPDKTVADIASDHGISLATLYDALHLSASQGGTSFRRDWITWLDRRIAQHYEAGVPVRTIKELLHVGAGRIYRVVRKLGLNRRR